MTIRRLRDLITRPKTNFQRDINDDCVRHTHGAEDTQTGVIDFTPPGLRVDIGRSEI
jgi:hypothetical protein